MQAGGSPAAPAAPARRPAPAPPSAPDPSGAGQWGGSRSCTRRAARSPPAKPCQQRRAEENGSPHLCRCLPRQGALDRLPESATSLPCHWAVQPAPRSSARLHSTSESLGTPRSRTAAGRAVQPPEAAVRCFLLPGHGPFRSKATHPLPRSGSALCAISAAPIPQKIPQAMQRERGMSIRLISQEFGASFVPVYLR